MFPCDLGKQNNFFNEFINERTEVVLCDHFVSFRWCFILVRLQNGVVVVILHETPRAEHGTMTEPKHERQVLSGDSERCSGFVQHRKNGPASVALV